MATAGACTVLQVAGHGPVLQVAGHGPVLPLASSPCAHAKKLRWPELELGMAAVLLTSALPSDAPKILSRRTIRRLSLVGL